MGTVTKIDLAKMVAEDMQCPDGFALSLVDSLFKEIRRVLVDGDRIEVRGFGGLDTRDTRPKPRARNPRTGEIIYVPAGRKTHFKPGKDLKEALHERR